MSTVPAEANANGDGGHSVRIRRALISVSDKTGVADFARGLAELGVELVSTGGTAAALEEAGLEVRSVEELTGAPEILDGRVKTLHPHLHAGLLARRDDPSHLAVLEEQGIDPIDLVCVNLYPFEQTVAREGVSEAEALENVDIGGPTMIRAAAKNHKSVAVVVKPESYDAVLAEIADGGGKISEETRRWLANEAFAQTARYDAAINRWFAAQNEVFPTHFVPAFEKFLDLSYGENPHQRAALYSEVGARSHILSRVAKLHGRALSFNNVLDLDSARRIVAEFDAPSCAIVKHNNPSGVAVADSVSEAYARALACDPMSAFGGVIAFNRPVGLELARSLHENFIEVLIAPEYDEEGLAVLQEKEAIRILLDEDRRAAGAELDLKRVRGGLLVQEADSLAGEAAAGEVVTSTEPTAAQRADMEFAWAVCRHVRSNAIVIAKDGATLGIGAGQMSRVDLVRIALDKAGEARGEDAPALLAGASMASDAFFPFPDGPAAAIEAGIKAIVQPGGSKRDEDVISAANDASVAMVFTGRRHFRH
ncbi:MAG: bifunctional phosphoribosylaminoimidazolecarboxamide formyltransferase/IMP cyclohydrolase [Solirubrobacterales bacterium]